MANAIPQTTVVQLKSGHISSRYEQFGKVMFVSSCNAICGLLANGITNKLFNVTYASGIPIEEYC